MKIIEVEDYNALAKKASEMVIKRVSQSSSLTLGLATGSTPLGVYEHLREDFINNKTSYKSVKTFNLDEYVGLEKSNPNSYYYYMYKNLFDHIDIPSNQIHIPNGMAKDLEAECQRYEEQIDQVGGIDLQLLGIGVNGHIGFNEPGTSFDSITHVVKLAESTRIANSRFFHDLSEVPTHAITMGIASIMKSKEILLLAYGLKKAQILYDLMTKTIDERLPASILKRHPRVTIIADKKAMSIIKEKAGIND
ncbi:glucosamine-6-phosphate deaminase [Tepidibacillus fermentans]|uniref:Glucosamine-6-phosphate deaminase n=1 Tax=Tepidibacillus fermentans TaxID=1281767 RepID=A0A4R3KEW9_9BACI|nr:glucosamine-6-phosphate deaminase [Tepidibacillus fermentans]TCS81817.1 glucosamine-6-phosphate deaminase [Tepidibacillus fermentans]